MLREGSTTCTVPGGLRNLVDAVPWWGHGRERSMAGSELGKEGVDDFLEKKSVSLSPS